MGLAFTDHWPHDHLAFTDHWPHDHLAFTDHWPHDHLAFTDHWPHDHLAFTDHWPHDHLAFTDHWPHDLHDLAETLLTFITIYNFFSTGLGIRTLVTLMILSELNRWAMLPETNFLEL